MSCTSSSQRGRNQRRSTASSRVCRGSCASVERRSRLIVTTSYDLALEEAFIAEGEEFDVVTYLATGAIAASSATSPPAVRPA